MIIPRHWVRTNTGALVIDAARAKLLEQTDHAGTPRLMYFLEHRSIE